MKKFLFISFLFFIIIHLSFAQRGIINNGGYVSVQNGAYITIKGSDNGILMNKTNGGNIGAIDNKGTIELDGDWTNNGNPALNLGLVRFIGTSDTYEQKINGNNNWGNIEIKNAGGVSVQSGNQILYEIFYQTKGQFKTNNQLTLISTPTKTALIDGGLNDGIDLNSSVTGNVTVQRYIPGNNGYHYFSVPTSDATVAQFNDDYSITGFGQKYELNGWSNFWYYDETNVSQVLHPDPHYTEQEQKMQNGWESPANLAVPLIPMKGYCLFINSNITVDVVGTVNNGAQSISLTNTPSGDPAQDGWNFVGNPYPSPIDWDAAAGWTKTNVANGIYFFRPTTSYYGVYDSYVNGVPTGSGTNIIAGMQGFFVKCTAPTGTLACDNRVRTTELNPTFFKSAYSDKKLIRLTANKEGYKFADNTILYFDNNATDGFDPNLDAYKFIGTDPNIPNIYFRIDKDTKFSIDALPNKNIDKIIPLGFRVFRSGTFSIRLKDMTNFVEGENVYLEDKQTGIVQSLKENPIYTFTAKDGDAFDGRFYLHYKSVKDSVCELPKNVKVTNINPTTATLNWTPVNGASYYMIRYSLKNNPNDKKMYFAKAGQTSVNISGLEAGQTYVWQIRVICGGNIGYSTSFSPLYEFTTKDGDICNVPENISVSSITPSSAVLNWEFKGQAERFSIRWRELGGIWHYLIVNGNDRSCKLGENEKLKAITSYEWQIMTYCSNLNNSDYSVLYRFRTNGDNKIAMSENSNKELNEQLSDEPIFSLYPNPYNKTTTIDYQLNKPSTVSLEVYNLIGQNIKTFSRNIQQSAGHYTFNFSAKQLGYNSGLYFIKLTVNGQVYQLKAVEY
jgi:hypothetical protein